MISILQLNCRGVSGVGDSDDMLEWVTTRGICVVALSETFLGDGESLVWQGWRFIGSGRLNRRGGGVAWMVRADTAFKHRPDLETGACESVWIELLGGGRGALLCSAYVPPAQHAQMQELSKEVGQARMASPRLMVLGDMNSRCFALGDSIEDATMAHAFLDMIDTHRLVVHNEMGVVTRHGDTVRSSVGSVLDITLTTPALAPYVQNWSTHWDFNSDHCGITFSVRAGARLDDSASRSIPGWRLARTDWPRFRAAATPVFSEWLRMPQDTPERM